MKPSSFTRQALRDVARIADRYDQEKEGLGDKFVERVYEAVDRIEANPEGYALEFRQLRRCNLRKFPHSLYFEIRPDDSLIVACIHHKRDSVLVKERAMGVIEFYKPDPK